MPIFEYKCLKCGRISEHLVFNEKEFKPFCRFCGSAKVKKLISRVKVRLSMDTRLEKMCDPALFGSLDEENPKSVMKFMEKMGAEFGDQLGDEFDEVMEEAREEVEKEFIEKKSDSQENLQNSCENSET